MDSQINGELVGVLVVAGVFIMYFIFEFTITKVIPFLYKVIVAVLKLVYQICLVLWRWQKRLQWWRWLFT